MTDILQMSGGLARYQIVQRIDVDGFPAKVDGYHYDAETYLNVIRGVTRPYMPQEADYYAIIERFNILELVARGMRLMRSGSLTSPTRDFTNRSWADRAPFGAMHLRSGTQKSAGRRFVIMGFSYERGVGEMLENMGHRAEFHSGKNIRRVKRRR